MMRKLALPGQRHTSAGRARQGERAHRPEGRTDLIDAPT
jgi:hypothetical protein